MEVTGVDRGGHDGGRSQLPLVCVRNVQSNLGRGQGGPVRPGHWHHPSALETLLGVT